jgi:biotin operon repressor
MEGCIKLPAFQFYPGDWMKDPALRSVSFAARGLWMDMLCLIHEVNQNGKLVLANGKPIGKAQLARMVGGSEQEISELLQELEDSGVCSRDEKGAYFSRRMERDQAMRAMRRACGAKGGNPNLVKQKSKPQVNQNPTPSVSSSDDSETHASLPVELPPGFPATESEAKALSAVAGVPEDFALQTWTKAMSRGGTDAKGQPIRSFRHYLAIEFSYERQRKNQQSTTNNQNSKRGPDRSKGTLNEGTACDYAQV